MSAERGMTEWTANGVDYTINDPNIAEEFDPTKAYHVRDHVYYQGNLYVFVAEHAAGAWNTSHVLLFKVGAELANLWSANDTEATLRLAADNDLKSALSDGFYKIDADWARGAISNGSYSPSNYYRVATKTAIALHKGDVIICADSYRFDVYGALEWTTNGVIQADGNYLIQIRQEPEATSQITNIEPFVNAVKINTIYQREIDELDYSKSNYEPTGNLVDKNHLFANSLLQHGTGIAVNGSGYITDFIPVKSGEVLQWRNVDSWYAAFYNTSKEYTSNITLSNNTYTVPADGYIRATITSANLNSAVICRWLNWSNNSNYEKSANDLVARSALKNGGTYSFEYFCGVIGGDGKLQKYVAPSTRIAAYPPLYISEGKVNISVESPYQWACSAYKNGSLVTTVSWTSGSGSVVVNKCDFIVIGIRKYVDGSEQTMTGYESFGLTVSVDNGINSAAEYGATNKTLIKTKERTAQNEPYAMGIGSTWRVMSHLFIDGIYDESNPIIPSQSIHDIEAIARLGFHIAEGNIHRTSDGYYVVSHGNQGKLGGAFETNDGQAVGDVTFAGQTLEQLKTLYRFRSTHEKYRTRILTMEEWLYACAKYNIIPLLQPSAITISKEFVDKARKIAGNRLIISCEGNTDIRDYYDGAVTNYSAYTNLNNINQKLLTFGPPFIWCIEAIAMRNLTESQLKAIVDLVHSYGCLALIPAVYLTVPQRIMAMRCGFDLLGSGWDVEDFHDGNIDHLIGDVTFDDFSHEGTVTNETLVLANEEWISNVNSDNVHIGKGSLHIKFNGTIHVQMGRYIDTDITSDGTEDIWLSTVYLDERPIFNIQAQSAVTVYNITFDSSRC